MYLYIKKRQLGCLYNFAPSLSPCHFLQIPTTTASYRIVVINDSLLNSDSQPKTLPSPGISKAEKPTNLVL